MSSTPLVNVLSYILFVFALSALVKAQTRNIQATMTAFDENVIILLTSSYLTTHRAPEVFLGLPLTEALDMWSLGCVVANAMLTDDFFSGDTEYDVVSILLMNCELKTECFQILL